MTISCPNGEPSPYEYRPSIAASVLWIIIFGGLNLAHSFRMIRSRQWFMLVFIGGGCIEVSGYVVRILGHNNPCSENTEIVQKILLLVAPSVFAATIYMILGRTIVAVCARNLSPIRPSLLTKVFVVGDVACFCIQLGGAAIMSGGASSVNLGRYIILAGLGLQMILFGLFVFVAYIFHTRINRNPTEESHHPHIQWEMMLFVLYGVSTLIVLRNIFRVAETAGGRGGYLLAHEWPLYVFDSTPMAGVMAVLLYYFPTLIRPKTSFAMDNLEARPVLGHRPRKGYTNVRPPSLNSH